ncbi:hypothetical protein [Mycolicibacterium phocaicum]|uniref:hypothetical protein n=1 Tax=Mycolicibacterium phocaicum TaxID=319706 RepID=UPI0009298766|nr:hypothetical protein [Mycolicibacterium phocaicum]UCZ61574.1 hypothetical protein LHJ73_04915 [Mycolicibacterium phocaicum]SHW20353.1 Uncharacterised protein [Mycobacteroides abscessus subsp. abscessus]
MVFEPPSGLRDSAPDLGVVAENFGSLPFPPLAEALLSLTLARFGGTLAFIGAPLALVRRLIALVGDAVSLVGDAVPFIGDPIAPRLFCFTNCERALSAVEVGATPIRFAPGTGLSAIDHNQP